MKALTAYVTPLDGDESQLVRDDVVSLFVQAQKRGYAWIIGEEGGNLNDELVENLVRVGCEHEYMTFAPYNNEDANKWFAVRLDLYGRRDIDVHYPIETRELIQDLLVDQTYDDEFFENGAHTLNEETYEPVEKFPKLE